MKFPLKYLAFYRVRKDFDSAPGFDGAASFKQGQLLQYQKTNSNIYDMMEIVSFVDWNTKAPLIWHVYTETLHDDWGEYLEEVTKN
jgi:hypothetical protein